jgi:hypothetical protein
LLSAIKKRINLSLGVEKILDIFVIVAVIRAGAVASAQVTTSLNFFIFFIPICRPSCGLLRPPLISRPITPPLHKRRHFFLLPSRPIDVCLVVFALQLQWPGEIEHALINLTQRLDVQSQIFNALSDPFMDTVLAGLIALSAHHKIFISVAIKEKPRFTGFH